MKNLSDKIKHDLILLGVGIVIGIQATLLVIYILSI